MVGIFRRLYDWLLSLFWYVSPPPVDVLYCPPLVAPLDHAPASLVVSASAGRFVVYRDPERLQASTMLMMLTEIRNRATEMDITMIGLQNAGKTSLLRVLAVSSIL